MTTRWSLGVLIGGPVLALVGLLIVAALWLVWRLGREWWDREAMVPRALPVTILSVALAGWLVGVVAGYWPFSAEYHQWRPTSGKVLAISSRFLGNGQSSTTQRFVVQLEGVGQRSCDDTRCALVHKGDVLHLSCKRSWQFSGVPGYDCNYVRDDPA
jgi:hypothetical protein